MTVLVGVPSLLRILCFAWASGDLKLADIPLRLIIGSGETLQKELCDELYERLPCATVVNIYGTTEVCAS